MSILALTAAAAAAPAGENPYGLWQALEQGGIIAWSVFIILVGMSIFSFYILFTKLMQQQKIIAQGRKVRASFWNSPNLREAAKKLIAAQQEVKQKQMRDQTEADVLAYMKVKEAEGQRQAAQMQYEAKLRLAEADAQAAARRAEGERAVKMVDVNVEREKVNVEQARVEVERQSLANKSEFEEAALKFELEKLRIQAEKEFRIAAASALGNMLAKANMQIFGDPTTMAQMSEKFMRAAALGNGVDGLLRTLPAEGQELLARIGTAVANSLKPADGNGAGAEAAAPTPTPPGNVPVAEARPAPPGGRG